jgi:hypothetical protein
MKFQVINATVKRPLKGTLKEYANKIVKYNGLPGLSTHTNLAQIKITIHQLTRAVSYTI